MKRTMLSLFIFAAMAVAQTGSAPGQPPQGRQGPRLEAVKQALQLTDEQINRLREIRKADFEAVRPIGQQMREKGQLLRENIQAGAPAAEVGQIVLELEGLKTQLRQIHENSQNEAIGVLDASQQELLEKLKEAIRLQAAIGHARALGLLGGGPQRPSMAPMGPGGRGGARLPQGWMAPRGRRGPGGPPPMK